VRRASHLLAPFENTNVHGTTESRDAPRGRV